MLLAYRIIREFNFPSFLTCIFQTPTHKQIQKRNVTVLRVSVLPEVRGDSLTDLGILGGEIHAIEAEGLGMRREKGLRRQSSPAPVGFQ